MFSAVESFSLSFFAITQLLAVIKKITPKLVRDNSIIFYPFLLPPKPERPEDRPPPWEACPPIAAIRVRSALLMAAKPRFELPEEDPPRPEVEEEERPRLDLPSLDP